MTYQEFQQTYSVLLDPQQEEAVRQTEGPVLLLAVPGSGKTTVLVTRLGYLLLCRGVAPERILTVTYTVAAARDMKRRFASLFGEELADKLAFRTINGLCDTVIRRYVRQKERTPFTLVSSDGQLSGVVRELLVRTGADYPTDLQVKDARTHITFCKNMMLSEAEVQNHQVDGMDFPALYFEYMDYMTRSKLMDFDDQLVFACRILRQHPDILAWFQERYRYLCVDEAQDTSKIQHIILRLLAAAHNNIFMVGDEDQSIYGFRAAWPQALLEFEHSYPGAKVLLMETNYRSTQTIVERADAFIQRNQNRHAKHMQADHPPGEPIRKIKLADYNRQYNYLLKVARSCSQPTAVLFRNNDSALPLIDLLDRESVPYSCRQREGFFFSSPLVRDLTDILSFAYDECNRDAFLRFYYKLDLKIKRTVLAGLLRYQREGESVFETLLGSDSLEPWQIGRVKALQTHFSKLPQLTSFAALQRIIHFMGYGDYLKEQRADTGKLDILLALANQTKETGSFLLRLQALKELAEGGACVPDCPFLLSTIHASKGLEYDRVLLIDVIDGVFPSVTEPRGAEALSGEEQAALEEERRLFYVGVTRARQQLEVLTYEKKFGEESGTYSTFVAQLLGEEAKQEPAAAPRPRRGTSPGKPGPTAEQVAVREKDYIPGTEITHKVFGRGTLVSRVGSIATIDFYELHIKKVDLATCLQKDLIRLT